MNIEDIIAEIKIKLLNVFPFLGIPLLKIPIKKSSLPFVAWTDYRVIYYNEEMMKTLTKQEIAWALVHEVLHIVYKHDQRQKEREDKPWNYACDYAIHDIMEEYIKSVIAYNQTNKKDRKIKVDNIISRKEGWLYNPKYHNMSAEEIYNDLQKNPNQMEKGVQFDDHTQWDSQNQNNKGNGPESEDEGKYGPVDDYNEKDWDIFMVSAIERAKEKMAGSAPAGLDRLLKSLVKPPINWYELLYNFLQFEVTDYSFCPPDKRNQSECILPDFNYLEQSELKNVLFFIDTSGSMTDEIITMCYAGIISIFDFFTHLRGFLGFFDYDCYGLELFENIEDIIKIKPKGGGGTNFHAPFEWINKNFTEEIEAIIILTDGRCDYPSPSITNVPVLWLFIEEPPEPPPFGVWTIIKT